MRHRIADFKFNRDANERKSLFTGMLRNLVEHGQIVTTRVKAKAIKRLMDKLITRAKQDTVASRRILHQTFGKRDVVNTLVERIAPAMASRTSGFTRIVELGSRRGDNTPMVRMSFVDMPDKVDTLKSGKVYVEKPKKAKKAVSAEAKPVAVTSSVAKGKKAVAKKPTKKVVKK